MQRALCRNAIQKEKRKKKTLMTNSLLDINKGADKKHPVQPQLRETAFGSNIPGDFESTQMLHLATHAKSSQLKGQHQGNTARVWRFSLASFLIPNNTHTHTLSYTPRHPDVLHPSSPFECGQSEAMGKLWNVYKPRRIIIFFCFSSEKPCWISSRGDKKKKSDGKRVTQGTWKCCQVIHHTQTEFEGLPKNPPTPTETK